MMKRDGRPASIVTDRLPSYRAAMKVIGNEGCQETGRWLNNRAEHSHQPFRRREGAMARFRDITTLQTFTSVHALDPQPFQPPPPSQSPRHFQTRPSRRPGRVASTCSLIVLDCRFFGSSLISLTMPHNEFLAGGGHHRDREPQVLGLFHRLVPPQNAPPPVDHDGASRAVRVCRLRRRASRPRSVPRLALRGSGCRSSSD